MSSLRVGSLLSLFIFCPLLSAHEFNPAHLVIDETAENTYQINWMYPVKNIGPRAEIIFPDTCSSEAQSPYQQGKYLVEKIDLLCGESLKGQIIEVTNLSVLTDALVTITHLNNDVFEGLMNLKESKLLVPIKQQSFPSSYFTLGVDHLISGIDHILFILGLLFLVTGIVNMIKTITAFTIAHSITLGLSVLDLISLPRATVEAVIALTIVFLALEISENKQYKSAPWLIAFGFGLLHGLGFANALTGIGIANEQLLLSLLFFNLGIEAGQLLMIPIFGAFIWLAYKFNIYKQSATCVSYILGAMGFFWFINRTIGIIY
ncbi:MAG TPA: HupE/UreJ protein [Flavobacteriales bacterium]|nr:HupE/UreJ protein [Flavobacteriales bacterium]